MPVRMAEETLTSPPPRRPDQGAAFAGRLPPHSIEAEEYLLSCCLLDGADVISRCLEARIRPESFYLAAHGLIYERMLELYNRQAPVDVAVLSEELKTAKQLEAVGGYAFLVQVSSRIPTTAQAGYFIDKVRELHLLRELIKSATGAVEECYGFSGGIEEFVDQIEQRIFAVTQNRVTDAARSIKESVREANAIVARLKEKKGEYTGVASGFTDLDKFTFGFQRGEMIVLAARPSMGKTALALNIAEHAALPGRPNIPPAATLIFSLEMTAASLTMRLLCSRAQVRYAKIRDGFLDNDDMDKLGQASRELSDSPLFIDDSSALSIMQLRAKARRIHARHQLGFIVVDYLQLLSPTDSKMPREQQVAEASRGLKALAKELNLPVLVLSQLNRSSEKENRSPKLADLRESGSIEQDADVVLMLTRPKDADEKFQVASDSAELIVAKQRNGPVGELKLTFLRDITRFENYTQ